MKKIVIAVAAFVFILLLTKIANQAPPEQPAGIVFSLKAQKVVECSADDITLVDNHNAQTHLFKDASWPDCSTYHSDDVLDFYLARGAKTSYVQSEKTVWWRKVM